MISIIFFFLRDNLALHPFLTVSTTWQQETPLYGDGNNASGIFTGKRTYRLLINPGVRSKYAKFRNSYGRQTLLKIKDFSGLS
jgi:hypothetical protein